MNCVNCGAPIFATEASCSYCKSATGYGRSVLVDPIRMNMDDVRNRRPGGIIRCSATTAMCYTEYSATAYPVPEYSNEYFKET